MIPLRMFAPALFLVAACEPGDFVAEPDPVAHAAADNFVVERVFGEFDPTAAVARCGDAAVSVADVALWLHLFPVLTVEQAVDDLLDLCVAESQIDPAPLTLWEAYAGDARLSARAAAWVLHTVVLDASLDVPAERVDAWVAAPENQTEFGRPELAVVSHAVALVPEGAAPEVAASAEQLVRRVHQALISETGAIGRPQLAAAVEGVRADAEAAGVTLRVETGLRFPRRYSGPRNWAGGLDAVVDEFADAAFATEPGGVFAPTRTSYGWHVGVVEAREAADMLDESDRRAKAYDVLRDELLRNTMDNRLRELYARTEVLVDPESVNLLTTNAMERIATSNRQP